MGRGRGRGTRASITHCVYARSERTQNAQRVEQELTSTRRGRSGRDRGEGRGEPRPAPGSTVNASLYAQQCRMEKTSVPTKQ